MAALRLCDEQRLELLASKEREAKLRKTAKPLADRIPTEGYPTEWNTDPVFVKQIPICEIIALTKALADTAEKEESK